MRGRSGCCTWSGNAGFEVGHAAILEAQVGAAGIQPLFQGAVVGGELVTRSLRVKVYAGPHPVTGSAAVYRKYGPAGALVRDQAEEACRRLLGQVRRSRRLRSHATLGMIC
jgi:hypothetical protein